MWFNSKRIVQFIRKGYKVRLRGKFIAIRGSERIEEKL